MQRELAERRDEVFRRYFTANESYGDVTTDVAQKHGVSKKSVERDIATVNSWVGELDELTDESGHSRLLELRQNRQRMQAMAAAARENGDVRMELKIRRQIDRSIETDVSLSQSLGLTTSEPDRVEFAQMWADDLETNDDEEVYNPLGSPVKPIHELELE